MPHQCTNCGRSFADGSKQMLAGCPDCGGNKFQFLPDAALADTPPGSGADRPEDSHPGSVSDGGATAQSTLEAYPSSTTATEVGPSSADTDPVDPDADIIEAPSEPIDDSGDLEDRAQASARRSVVTQDELPPIQRDQDVEVQEDELDRPDLAQLREELNEQFESIKILQPGEYELNLMELYDRDEYIIALEEDGRYVIDVPDSWDDAA